jgi:hypothetical protein
MLEIICYPLAPKGSKDMQITQPDAGGLICDWLWHDDWEVMPQSFFTHVRTLLDSRLVKPLRSTWVAKDLFHDDVKQAVS